MPFTVTITGLDTVRARITALQAALPEAVMTGMQQIGTEAVSALSAASPVGNSGADDTPPAGDAPGALRDSFQSTLAGDGSHANLTVFTTQPQKLSWVVNGRGWVFPLNKKALFWNGLPHPVMFSHPSEPNDFVSPVVDDITASAVSTMIEAINAALEL